jgi:hypothetical protein
MKAIELLREEQKRFRIYDDCNVEMDFQIAEYKKSFPDQNWDDYLRVLSEERYAMRPMIRWGPADTSAFRTELGMILPDWMEEFYKQVTSAVLSMIECIVIMSPEDCVANQLGRIDVLKKGGVVEPDPCRMVPIAECGADGAYFYLYQRLDGRWSIIYGAGWRTAPNEESAEDEDYDANIDEWIERLLRTDAFPLGKGNEEIEPKYFNRVGFLDREMSSE